MLLKSGLFKSSTDNNLVDKDDISYAMWLPEGSEPDGAENVIGNVWRKDNMNFIVNYYTLPTAIGDLVIN